MSTPLLYGILVALIWGVQPVVSRYGFQLGLSAQDATLVRYLVSGLLMLPYACKRGLADACGIGWHRALLLFLLSGPLFSLILIGGVNFAPASHGALIHPALTPLFGALISRFALKQPERFSLFAMLLLLGGLGLIGIDSMRSPDAVTSAGAWRGDLLFVLSAFMWAWYLVLNKAWKTAPLDVVALVQVLSLICALPYLAFFGMGTFEQPASALWLQAIYHGLAVSIIGVALFNWVVAQMGVKALMLGALSPLFGMAASALALGEPLRSSIVVGALTIVAGLVLSLRAASAPHHQDKVR